MAKEIENNKKETEVVYKTTSASTFTLPNKKVILKPNYRPNAFMGIENHDGSFLYTQAFREWCIFRTSNGSYIDPLSTAERLYLEKELGEDLNVNHKENYWKTHTFKIKKQSSDLKDLQYEFNLSNPIDFLNYKLLLTAPNVASNMFVKDDSPEYKWLLIEKDEEIQGNITVGKMKAFCYKWLDENEFKTETLRELLWVMDIPVSTDNSKDELMDNIIQLIEDKRKLEFLYKDLKDDALPTKIFLTKCLKSRFIIPRLGKYYDNNGELLAVNKDAILKWIANPENSLRTEQWKEDFKKINFK